MNLFPHEFAIGGVFVTPWLVASIFGVFCTVVTTKLLNYYGLTKYFSNIPLVYLSFLVIYTIIITTFIIGG